jgi:hypothetical protein
MKRLPALCLGACLALTAATCAAQNATGVVTGTVHDEKSGEELIGANVLLVGTTLGASADLDGKFTIRAVPPGTYDLRVSYVGYAGRVVKGLVVTPGEPTRIDLALAEMTSRVVEEIVVTAERVRSTEAAVLSERRLSAVIGDAISAEQIKRSPDATSSDALKRVTGLTIVDNKFVFIRGVTDRYNGTLLNGVSVTSTDTDVDKKSFSFDLFPSSLLENTVVVKSATPDLPGDFSGGLVQVNTLEFPEKRVARLSLSTSYDDVTSTRSMLASPGGGHDWLGRDDGSREFPGGNPTGAALAGALPNDWVARSRQAPLNGSLNLSVGDRLLRGESELGFVGAFSYKSGYQISDFTDRPTYFGYPLFSFTGQRFTRTVLWGGLANLNWKYKGLHKFSFRNNYNQAAEDKVSTAEGLPASGEFTRKQTIEWDQRSFWLGQLAGEHKLPALGGLEAKWRLFRSLSSAEEPDRKEVEFERGASGVFSLKDNYRTWAELDENARGAGLDLTWPVGAVKLKTGGIAEKRERTYGIRAFSTDQSYLSPANYGLSILPLDRIFAAENYGPGKFTFPEVEGFTGAYIGRHRLDAVYAMLDAPFEAAGRRFRFAGGARVEDSRQDVDTVDDGSGEPIRASIAESDLLPSANLAWLATDNLNLRLAYGRSVNRPELREMANVLYYDYDLVQNVIGNPRLRRAIVDNYDVRAEFFPRPGEVVAVSWFYKSIEDAIEERLLPSPERFVRTWFNSPDGRNYGWEFEARRNLGFLGPLGERFSLAGNYTRVRSAISYVDAYTDPQGNTIREDRERVMQGQSPWMANVSLLYVDAARGTSVNVLYGRIGRRLDAVGDSRNDDVYEESRDVLDLALTQKLGARWETKLTVKDALAQDATFTSGSLRETYSSVSRGTVWSLTAAWSY